MRLTLHEGDRVAFLDRRGHPTTGLVLVVPWGRRLWAGLRASDGRVHVVPRSSVIGPAGDVTRS